MTVMDVAQAAPQRSLSQRMDALEVANRVRVARAQMKRDMKAGRVPVLEVLVAPPWHAETMKVHDLLVSAPKIGRVKAATILRRAEVSPSKTLCGMTRRQRLALIREMGRR